MRLEERRLTADLSGVTSLAESDAEWLAAARARVAAGGSWERPIDDIKRDALALGERNRAARAAGMKCPYCDDHPPLEEFRRYELVTMTPLYYCPRCFGFWAMGDSLSRGAADPNDEHPALRAGLPPKRCRACNGHLKPNGECSKCKRPLPALGCPACHKPMGRTSQRGILLDVCSSCNGVWFDIGEIAAVFEIEPPQGLAASQVDEHETDDDPPAWLMALEILLGGFLRFL